MLPATAKCVETLRTALAFAKAGHVDCNDEHKFEFERANAAEAERDALRAALVRINETCSDPVSRQDARAVLASKDGTP